MKDYSIIKKRICELDSVVGDSALDASGPTTEEVDYNFDLLRKKYDGTDFHKEANCMCDLMGLFASRCKDKDRLPALVGSISQILRGDGFESPDDIMEKYSRFVDEVGAMFKNPGNSQMMKTSPPDFKSAQAKLLELENYIETTGLKSDKWNRYLDNARKLAAVGDYSFDPAPKMGEEDVAYMRERDRKQQKKEQMFQSMVTA